MSTSSTSVFIQTLRASAWALVILGLAGCQSAGYKKSDAAASSMQTAAAEVQAESQALEFTMDALKGLMHEPAADLRPQFKRFSSALERLAASATRVQNTGQLLSLKHAAYLQAWDKQLQTIDFELIRDQSQARKTTVASRFESLNQRYQETQAVVQPLITYLQDIRKALSADLTPGGLEALKGIAQNADQNAGKVHIALAALTRELTTSSSRMSSIALQNVQ